jgi:hypothetical protein
MNLNLGAHEQTMGTIAGARRAVAIERRAATSFQVDVVPLAALDALVEPWTALAAQAVEPNVFMEPAFALPATPVLGSDVRVGLIWSKSSPRELLCLFPVRIVQWRYGMPLWVI